MKDELMKKYNGNKEIGGIELLFSIILICCSWVVSAYCLTLYVKWFLNPIFEMKIISLSEGICLVLVFGFLTRNIKRDDEEKSAIETTTTRIMGTIIFIVLGYVCFKIFMN